jgi:hypothetical protein
VADQLAAQGRQLVAERGEVACAGHLRFGVGHVAARFPAPARVGRETGMNTTAAATRRATLALPSLLTATFGRAQAPCPAARCGC